MSKDPKHYSVYVVELSPEILKHKKVLTKNPQREEEKPIVYVGSTGLPVEERYKKHKAGIKGNVYVQRYGIRLIPELYRQYNPMTFEEAEAKEVDLAHTLRLQGYTVLGGNEQPEKTAATSVKDINSTEEFKPDFTASQLKSMGVYKSVYGTGPRYASLSKWPAHWMDKRDPKGWLQWYERYSKGRRIEDDTRQIGRWNNFKSRHGGPFSKRPTARRYYALRNWGIEGKNLVTAKQWKDFEPQVKAYKQKIEKKADWAEFDLKRHQQRVARRMADPRTKGLVVAHGTGSGKTLSSIATYKKLGLPTTVVPPAALIGNYEKEIGKWMGRQPKNLNIESQQRAALKGLAHDPKGGLLVVDEAHRARETESRLLASLQDSEAKKRMLLTGTPIVNHPKDLSTLVNFVANKRILPDTVADFNREYVQPEYINPTFFQKMLGIKPGIRPKLKNPQRLKKILDQYVDFHPNSQEGFPSIKQEELKVPMGEKQMNIYKSIMGQAPWWVRWKVKSGLPPGKGELDTMRAFLSGVRQVSNTTHGFTTRPDELEGPKIQQAFGYLNSQLQKDPTYKAVIYSNYLKSGLEPYKQHLRQYNIPFGEFSGNISPAVRNQLVRDYNANKLRALLISSAGAEGLDLKGTRLIQLLEPHFNEEKEKQIIGRGARYQSHAMLPPDKQNLLVQRYLATPRAGFLDKIMGRTEVKGADEYIRQLAIQKDMLNRQVMGLMNPVEKKRPSLLW